MQGATRWTDSGSAVSTWSRDLSFPEKDCIPNLVNHLLLVSSDRSTPELARKCHPDVLIRFPKRIVRIFSELSGGP